MEQNIHHCLPRTYIHTYITQHTTHTKHTIHTTYTNIFTEKVNFMIFCNTFALCSFSQSDLVTSKCLNIVCHGIRTSCIRFLAQEVTSAFRTSCIRFLAQEVTSAFRQKAFWHYLSFLVQIILLRRCTNATNIQMYVK